MQTSRGLQFELKDQHGRYKRQLRISVTDRCNFKCIYCMPEHPEWINKKQLLSFEALYQFCMFMVHHGIEKIRITGGEPLMRKGILHFIRELQKLRPVGLQRISMTTNAYYLAKYAQELHQAGLDDLNISLDSLDPLQFFSLTKQPLKPVLDGITAVQKINLPFKINTVLIKGKNDNQILPLIDWAMQQNVVLRFIEFMPLDGDRHWSQADVVSEKEILDIVSNQYSVEPIAQTHEPARIYRLDDQCTIGIISTITHSFCGQCDRLRLTAKGELYNCLFAEHGLPLKLILDQLTQEKDISSQQALKQQLSDQIMPYIWNKAEGFHHIYQQQNKLIRKISMHILGG